MSPSHQILRGFMVGSRSTQPVHGRPNVRRLAFERLEGRRLLAATDLAAITGVVFKDFSGNGLDSGEEIAGATVSLYRDDGDGLFEPGSGDTLLLADSTDPSGVYRFDDLVAGSYFVRQPAQTVGSETLNEYVSSRIVISSTAVHGVPGTVLDTFDTVQSVTASFPIGTTAHSSVAAPEAIGGERDLFVEMTAGAGGFDNIEMQTGFSRLSFNPTLDAAGRYVTTWDGPDGDATVLDPTGLAGFDLTDGGSSNHLAMTAGVQIAGTSATIRVYTDATHWSEAVVALSGTSGLPDAEYFVSFNSDFVAGSGAISGADFSNVGAVELEIEATQTAADGRITLLGAIGPTVFTQDFPNTELADLSLAKTIDNPTPNIGDNVTFTVTLTNHGPTTATNVVVRDSLPAGLTFVSSAPGQGSYNSGTGLWTVGTLANGATSSLQITAAVTTPGAKTNTAEVIASDQFDADSTPNNGDPTEDDWDSVSLTPQVTDLSLTKVVNNATPNLGDNVTFTLTLSNEGPTTATNVSVRDSLPAGLTFVSSTASQGSYSSGTGLWTVGTLANGASASLQIRANVATPGTKINTAQVSASDQFDDDSTPNNSDPAEDDQDSASLTPASSISGYVYVDADNDGVKDAGEAGIGNVTVRLSGNDQWANPVTRTTTTSGDGSYVFGNLPPSDGNGYALRETQPSVYFDGREHVGSLDGTVAVPSSSDEITQIVVSSGDSGQNYNFGELVASSLSGFVYYDSNDDGTKQGTEFGISGVTLALTGANDLGSTVVQTTTTGTDGSYRFGNLRPSDGNGYTVTETQPGGFIDGRESPGNPSLGADVLDNVFADLALNPGIDATNYNFGELVQLISKRRFLASSQ